MAIAFQRNSAVPSAPVDQPATAAELQYERACDEARKLEAAVPMLTSEEVHLEPGEDYPVCEWTFRFVTTGWDMRSEVKESLLGGAWLASEGPLHVGNAIALLRKALSVFDKPLGCDEMATRAGAMHACVKLALRELGADQ